MVKTAQDLELHENVESHQFCLSNVHKSKMILKNLYICPINNFSAIFTITRHTTYAYLFG